MDREKVLADFRQRLYTEIDDKDLKHKQIAAKAGIRESSLSAYFRDDNIKFPNSLSLLALADAMGVSMDYLFGRTDVASNDPDIRTIAEYTGLSKEAIEALHKIRTQYLSDGKFWEGYFSETCGGDELANYKTQEGKITASFQLDFVSRLIISDFAENAGAYYMALLMSAAKLDSLCVAAETLYNDVANGNNNRVSDLNLIRYDFEAAIIEAEQAWKVERLNIDDSLVRLLGGNYKDCNLNSIYRDTAAKAREQLDQCNSLLTKKYTRGED